MFNFLIKGLCDRRPLIKVKPAFEFQMSFCDLLGQVTKYEQIIQTDEKKEGKKTFILQSLETLVGLTNNTFVISHIVQFLVVYTI